MADRLYKTVKPSGGDYTSLEACMDANEQNLVDADDYFDVEIDGDWSGGADTTVCTINGYTTDITRYINIYTTVTAKHKGKWSTDYYILDVNNYNSYCIGVFDNFVTITGIQITNTGGGGSEQGLRITGEPVLIDKMIGQGFAARCVYNYDGTATVIRNSLVFDSNIAYDARSGTLTCLNCTAVDNTTGFEGVPTNCLGAHNGTDFAGGTMTYCASVDATASGTGCNAEIDDTNLFADYDNDDFHLQSGSTAEVKGAGDDLSGTFTDDIDGDTRSAWDIGADEYVAVTSGAVAVAGGYMTTSTKFW